ncbi:unnamed protein product [Aphanomyces euteiches]
MPLGLTLGFFKHFVEIHGGRKAFQGLTTGAVCTKFLLPYTASTKLSLVEHVGRQPDGHLYAKPATWFVSHAWSYLYLDVVDALDDFFQENGLDDSVAVWFCTFCNNQHEIEDAIHSFEHWFEVFRSSLRAIGNVVMVMSPWNNPTTLTRTWCVFEVYASVVENARFEIALGRSQKACFLQDFQNEGAFKQMLSTIQSEKSSTTVPSDRDNIFKLIRDEVGFAKLDRMVFEVIEKWMARTVHQQIDQAPCLEKKAAWLLVKADFLQEHGEFAASMETCQAAVNIYRQDLQDQSSDTWKAQTLLAALKFDEGHPREEWEPLLQESLVKQIRLLSKDHADTLATMHHLGHCYGSICEYDLGLSFLMECFERQRRVLGEENLQTRNTMSQIAVFLSEKGKLEEALEWNLRCFAIQRRILGDDHPETSRIRNNVGVAYTKLGDFASGAEHITACCEVYRRTLGPEHPKTLTIQANEGDSYRLLGDYTTAEKLLLDCLKHDHHFEHMKAHCKYLGLVYLGMKDYNRAMSVYQEALDRLAAVHGRSHAYYTRALPAMFVIKMNSGCFELLEEIDTFETELDHASWTKDIWKDVSCHGCRSEIHGLLYHCSECPPQSLRFCQDCIALNKPATFCKHGADAIAFLKPPSRYLQEKRLDILAKKSDWQKYETHFVAYVNYCDENQIAKDERLTNQIPTEESSPDN